MTNLQLEMLLDEVGKNENDTQLLTDEFEKFLENFENPEEGKKNYLFSLSIIKNFNIFKFFQNDDKNK